VLQKRNTFFVIRGKWRFNGLIESNFDGMSFDTYFITLSNKQDEIEKFLESQFWIDGSKIQDLT
jgi:hypothetical protein